MEDGNETLRTMSLNTNFNHVDGYMAIGVKDDKTPTTDETEVSTFTTETLPLANEKTFGHPLQKSRLYRSRTIGVFEKAGISSQGGRGENEFSCEESCSLDKWIVRKHGKIIRVIPHSNKQINYIEHIFTKQQLDQRIK